MLLLVNFYNCRTFIVKMIGPYKVWILCVTNFMLKVYRIDDFRTYLSISRNLELLFLIWNELRIFIRSHILTKVYKQILHKKYNFTSKLIWSSILSAIGAFIFLRVVHNVRFSAKSREICNLRLDVGRCEGHFDSWYYEVATGLCEQFQYSGCGGNANRFHSKEQCEGLCMHGAPARLGPSSFAPQPQAESQQGIVGNILDKAESAKNAGGLYLSVG